MQCFEMTLLDIAPPYQPRSIHMPYVTQAFVCSFPVVLVLEHIFVRMRTPCLLLFVKPYQYWPILQRTRAGYEFTCSVSAEVHYIITVITGLPLPRAITHSMVIIAPQPSPALCISA